MKKLVAVFAALLLFMTCVLFPQMKVRADEDGTITVTASSTEVFVGDEITITVSAALKTDGAGYISDDFKLTWLGEVVALNGTDGSGVFHHMDALSGQEQKNSTYTYTFQAMKAGTAMISVQDMLFGYSVPQDGRDFVNFSVAPASITVTERPAPTEPAPTEPAPTEPAPTEPAPTEPVSPITKIEPVLVNKNKQYYVGDVLTANDFYVYVVREDGTKEAVGGWNLSPLNLSLEENTLTFSYAEWSTTYILKAQAKEVVPTVPETEPATEQPQPSSSPEESTEPSTEEIPDVTEPTESEPEDGLLVKNVFGGTSMLISSDWGDEAAPAGFQANTATYNEEEIKIAVSDKGLTLYYLISEDNSVRNFYVLDPTTQMFYPYYAVSPNGKTYILLNGQDEKMTAGKRKVMLRINQEGPQLDAWTLTSNAEDKLFLVYAMIEDGTTGWFQFDAEYGTFVRYIYEEPEETQPSVGDVDNGELESVIASISKDKYEKESSLIADYNKLALDYKKDKSSLTTLIYIILAAFLIIFIIACVLAFRLRYLYRNYDFDDDDNPDGPDGSGGFDGSDDTTDEDIFESDDATEAIKREMPEKRPQTKSSDFSGQKKNPKTDDDDFEIIEF